MLVQILGLLNGSKLPNWVKALVLGVFLGVQAMIFLQGTEKVTASLTKRLDDLTWLVGQAVAEQQAIRRELRHVAMMDSIRTTGVEKDVEHLENSVENFGRQSNEINREMWRAIGYPNRFRTIQ